MKLFVLAFVVFGATNAMAATGCGGLKQYAELDMLGLPDRLQIPASINDSPRFLNVAVMAAEGVISAEAADELKLTVLDLIGLKVHLSGGETLTRTATARSVKLGNLMIPSMQFLLSRTFAQSEIAQSDTPATKSIGTIGSNLFRAVDTEFDFPAKKLRLFVQTHCGDGVVYWTNMYAALPFRIGALGEPVFVMELDGKKVEATLSTEGRSSLAGIAAEKLFGLTAQSGDPPDPKTPHFMHTFGSLKADDITINNAEIWYQPQSAKKDPHDTCHMVPEQRSGAFGFSEAKGNCIGPPPLSLGLRDLKDLRLYLSYTDKMIYFTKADSVSAQ